MQPRDVRVARVQPTSIEALDTGAPGTRDSLQRDGQEALHVEQDLGTDDEHSTVESLQEQSEVHSLMVEAVASLVGGLDALRVLHTATPRLTSRRTASPTLLQSSCLGAQHRQR